MSQRQVERLSEGECLALLGRSEVGRLVYHDGVGPAALPVNFAMVGGDILIRVSGGAMRQAVSQPTLGFEVDELVPDQRSAWSVLVRGGAEEVPQEQLPHLFRDEGAGSPSPWALGVHNVWIRLRPRVVTGRRLGAVGVPLPL